MYKFFLICFLLVSCTLFKEDKSRERIICENILNNLNNFDTLNNLINNDNYVARDSEIMKKKLSMIRSFVNNKSNLFFLEKEYIVKNTKDSIYKEVVFKVIKNSNNIDILSFRFIKINNKFKIMEIEKNPPFYYMYRRPKVEKYFYLAPPIH